MQKLVLGLAVVVITWVGALGAVRADDIALPDELHMVAPPPDLPHSLAVFAGVWSGGAWDGVLPHVFVVEHLASDGTATVVYAYGDAPEWHITRGWVRTTGTIAQGQLHLTLREGKAHVHYAPEGERTLLGFYDTERSSPFVRLTKTEVTTTADLRAAIHPLETRMEAELVVIPITTRDASDRPKSLKLAATLYRPTRGGRWPVVIFNHGSTGGGAISPALTIHHEAQAYYLLQRGFAVLSPMRKGRGGSEGPYNEPERCEVSAVASGVASALEDVDGVIEFVLTQPLLDPDRMLLAGISRGGYLSILYAGQGKHRARIKGVINFVGGWLGEACHPDLNAAGYAAAAPHVSVPTLWLYAAHDRYYTPPAIQRYVRAFTEAGGRAAFTLYDTIPGDGHRLARFVSTWKPAVDAYLDALGLTQK
jgi:dienelactone hydrolase